MQAKITKNVVDRLAPGETVWDADLPGFGVRRRGDGPPRYVLRLRGARDRLITIGRHGAPWTPQTARKRALELLGDVATGGDPATERDRRKAALSVAELAERFLAEHVDAKLKPTSQREYRRLLEKVAVPELGKLSVATLTRADVSKLVHKLRATPYQSNRMLAVLAKMFTWGERHGIRGAGENPAHGIDRFREARRQRFLSDVELERLGAALASCEAAGAVSPYAVAAIRLLLFTGCRLTEVLSAKWSDVDLQRGFLNLSDAKRGARAVFLSAPARNLFSELPRVADNPYVLPGHVRGSHFVNLAKPWGRVRSAAALDGVRIHDLRHSNASVAAGMGVSLPIIGVLLGHTQPQTTARYAHLAADPVRQAAERVGTRIDAALSTNRAPASVVELPVAAASRHT